MEDIGVIAAFPTLAKDLTTEKRRIDLGFIHSIYFHFYLYVRSFTDYFTSLQNVTTTLLLSEYIISKIEDTPNEKYKYFAHQLAVLYVCDVHIFH